MRTVLPPPFRTNLFPDMQPHEAPTAQSPSGQWPAEQRCDAYCEALKHDSHARYYGTPELPGTSGGDDSFRAIPRWAAAEKKSAPPKNM